MKCKNMIMLDPFSAYPCGKCYTCRVKKSREWSNRLLHEMSYWDSSLFLTLTYDDDHLPLSISKRELQLFIKRYRKEISKDGRKFKYYAVGEYGDTYRRPHYHIIAFGSVLSDFRIHPKIHGKYTSAAWPNGFVDVGTVEPGSISYVTGYVRKKLNRRQDDERYIKAGLYPPFQVQSQGLGLRWALDNAEYLKSNEHLTVKGVPSSIPRYYLNKLGLEFEDTTQERLNDFDERWEIYWTKRGIFDEQVRTELYEKMLEQGDRNIRAKHELHGGGSL